MNPQRFFQPGAGIILLLFCLGIARALALTLELTSVQELAVESELIVTGRIVSVEYVWEDETHRAINTLLTVEVDQYVKGAGNASVVVRQLGGHIGDFGDVIPGVPAFDPGEEVMLFLVKFKEEYWIHSMALGAFRVTIEEAGQKMVYNYLPDVTVVDPDTKQTIPGETVFKSAALPDFIAQVISYIR